MNMFRPIFLSNAKVCEDELRAVFDSLYPDWDSMKSVWPSYLPLTDIYNKCPMFVDAMKELGLSVKFATIVVIRTSLRPHIDYKLGAVRMHWPIYNHDSILTNWFEEIGKVDLTPFKYLANGEPYLEPASSNYRLSCSYTFTGPTIFRTDVIHSATVIDGKPLPRIAISVAFNEDELLEKMINEV